MELLPLDLDFWSTAPFSTVFNSYERVVANAPLISSIISYGYYAKLIVVIVVGRTLFKVRSNRMRLLLASLFFAALSCFDLATSVPSPKKANYHGNAGVLQYVNPKIGTFGYSPNGNGGMIPSVAPPFGMTRWTAQTRENFISQCPYHDADTYIHGFQGMIYGGTLLSSRYIDLH